MSTTIKQRVISNSLISELFKKINNRLQVINCFNASSALFRPWEYKFSVLVSRNYSTQGPQGASEQRKQLPLPMLLFNKVKLSVNSGKLPKKTLANRVVVPVLKGTGGGGVDLIETVMDQHLNQGGVVLFLAASLDLTANFLKFTTSPFSD